MTSGIEDQDFVLTRTIMKSLLLVLSVYASTVHSASANTTASPNNETATSRPWYDSQNYSYRYSVAVDVRLNLTRIRYCGGTQIGLEWVLTAAECLHNDTDWTSIVLIYSCPLMKYSGRVFTKELAKLVIHPDYDPKTKAHNIAIIKCHKCDTEYKSVIPTVPLAYQAKNTFSQQPAVFSAVLNIVHEGIIYGRYVKPIKTHIVSPFWCKVAHFFSLGDKHICASTVAGRLPKGEIGAPLVIEGHLLGRVQVVGIGTSVSHWPNWIPVPMIFTRVEPYSDWIRNMTGIK